MFPILLSSTSLILIFFYSILAMYITYICMDRRLLHFSVRNISAEGHFGQNFSVTKHFGHGFFRSGNISVTELFGQRTFRSGNISVREHFGHRTFRSQNISVTDFFGQWTIQYNFAFFYNNFFPCLRLKTPLNQFKAVWASQNDFSSLLFNLAEASRVKAIWPKMDSVLFFKGFLLDSLWHHVLSTTFKNWNISGNQMI